MLQSESDSAHLIPTYRTLHCTGTGCLAHPYGPEVTCEVNCELQRKIGVIHVGANIVCGSAVRCCSRSSALPLLVGLVRVPEGSAVEQRRQAVSNNYSLWSYNLLAANLGVLAVTVSAGGESSGEYLVR